VQVEHRDPRLGDRGALEPDDAGDVRLVGRPVAREPQVPVDAQNAGLGQRSWLVRGGEPARDVAKQGEHRLDPDRLVALFVGGEPVPGHLRRQLVPELHGVAIEPSERNGGGLAARHRRREHISALTF
jgi:hypothetical protein